MKLYGVKGSCHFAPKLFYLLFLFTIYPDSYRDLQFTITSIVNVYLSRVANCKLELVKWSI